MLQSPCAERADKVALLVLLAAELPGFVRAAVLIRRDQSSTVVPLAALQRRAEFFLNSGPSLADQYFPWLVNLKLSPAYWFYLVSGGDGVACSMGWRRSAASGIKIVKPRIDAAREKLETALKELADAGLTHAQMREASVDRAVIAPERRTGGQAILERLIELRARCWRYTGENSFATPMGDEMYYRIPALIP